MVKINFIDTYKGNIKCTAGMDLASVEPTAMSGCTSNTLRNCRSSPLLCGSRDKRGPQAKHQHSTALKDPDGIVQEHTSLLC